MFAYASKSNLQLCFISSFKKPLEISSPFSFLTKHTVTNLLILSQNENFTIFKLFLV